jgi:hypothetical protein
VAAPEYEAFGGEIVGGLPDDFFEDLGLVLAVNDGAGNFKLGAGEAVGIIIVDFDFGTAARACDAVEVFHDTLEDFAGKGGGIELLSDRGGSAAGVAEDHEKGNENHGTDEDGDHGFKH